MKVLSILAGYKYEGKGDSPILKRYVFALQRKSWTRKHIPELHPVRRAVELQRGKKHVSFGRTFINRIWHLYWRSQIVQERTILYAAVILRFKNASNSMHI